MIVRKQGMTKSLALCVLLALVGCGIVPQAKVESGSDSARTVKV